MRAIANLTPDIQMNELEAENDLSIWLSTYGLITTERVLGGYGIRLPQEELINAINNPNNIYHFLLRVPLKNVFNGIILEQAKDYQVYLQKLFIDYLLSGETGKSEDSPGALAREDLEKERKELLELDIDFEQIEFVHDRLIAESQKMLIAHAGEWQKKLINAAKKIRMGFKSSNIGLENSLVIQAVNILIISHDLAKNEELSRKNNAWAMVEKLLNSKLSNDQQNVFIQEIKALNDFTWVTDDLLAPYLNRINQVGLELRKWRSTFYNLILRVMDLLKQLPEYTIDRIRNDENRESLYFDASIGDEAPVASRK